MVAHRANIDSTGVHLDINENAYSNAFVERNGEDYQRLSPHPERWEEFLANISHIWETEPNYMEEQLGAVSTPIMILDGATDETIDLNQTKLIALLIPDAELVIIPDTGHFAMMEKPDECNRIVLDVLDA